MKAVPSTPQPSASLIPAATELEKQLQRYPFAASTGRLPSSIWKHLIALWEEGDLEAPVFPSRKRKANGDRHLSEVQVNRVVKTAAQRVAELNPQIAAKVSPHWLRHAHASHAMDRGAPVHLVQQTLGHASVATTGKYLHARPADSSARFLVL